jgi:hypothetical protein
LRWVARSVAFLADGSRRSVVIIIADLDCTIDAYYLTYHLD